MLRYRFRAALLSVVMLTAAAPSAFAAGGQVTVTFKGTGSLDRTVVEDPGRSHFDCIYAKPSSRNVASNLSWSAKWKFDPNSVKTTKSFNAKSASIKGNSHRELGGIVDLSLCPPPTSLYTCVAPVSSCAYTASSNDSSGFSESNPKIVVTKLRKGVWKVTVYGEQDADSEASPSTDRNAFDNGSTLEASPISTNIQLSSGKQKTTKLKYSKNNNGIDCVQPGEQGELQGFTCTYDAALTGSVEVSGPYAAKLSN